MSDDTLTLRPGAVVDRFRIDRVLGQGAFGTWSPIPTWTSLSL